ncbi:MAG: flagellar assembly protein FliH [Selenomonadaceae bacterium]|nr:flagellar assembly protein FliH [Selenomonadaceae bacterium]
MSKVISVPKWKNGELVVKDKGDDNARDDAEEKLFTEEMQAEFLAKIEAREKELDRLTAEANSALSKAKAEAEKEKKRILEDAQIEAEDLKEAAKAEGREEGLNEGREEGKKQALDEMKDAINSANEQAMKTLKDAKDATLDYMLKAEHDIAEVVLTVAEKIIPQHFIDAPQVVLPAVKEALLRIKDQKEIFVHVPPDSYDLVLMARDEFRSLLTGGNASLEIVADESLKPGDCLIETESGALDARLSTQLDLIRDAVREVLT